MTEEDKKLLNTFEAKLRHFMYLHDELKHENAQLKQLLTEKNEEVKIGRAHVWTPVTN